MEIGESWKRRFTIIFRDCLNSMNYIIDNICKNTSRSITKFIYDMVYGILASGDSRVSKISRMLFEKNIHITENRLTKNLMELDLSKIKENYYHYVFKNLLKINPQYPCWWDRCYQTVWKGFWRIKTNSRCKQRRKTKRKGMACNWYCIFNWW